MTVRDIQHHLAPTIGTDLSHDTISNITDAVLEEVKAWQNRPLDEIYPIIYMDALVVRVREGHQVRNKAAHIAVGVDLDGVKHVLGIWVQPSEGAKFWAGVCAELRNRGVRDVLIVCCDGLTGFPEAIEATWPRSTVQTCTVHLIRAAMPFISYADGKKVAAALRPIYTAPTAEAAEIELAGFENSEMGRRYPAAVATWRNAWDRFIPFLEFPPELRRIIYTTDAIESPNYQLRKIIKNRGQFPGRRTPERKTGPRVTPEDEVYHRVRFARLDERARARARRAGVVVEKVGLWAVFIAAGWRCAFSGDLINSSLRWIRPPTWFPPTIGRPTSAERMLWREAWGQYERERRRAISNNLRLASVDHATPLCRGGDHVTGNCRLAYYGCNAYDAGGWADKPSVATGVE